MSIQWIFLFFVGYIIGIPIGISLILLMDWIARKAMDKSH